MPGRPIEERDPLTSPSLTAECSQAISTVASRSKGDFAYWSVPTGITVTGHGATTEDVYCGPYVIRSPSCFCINNSNLPPLTIAVVRFSCKSIKQGFLTSPNF